MSELRDMKYIQAAAVAEAKMQTTFHMHHAFHKPLDVMP